MKYITVVIMITIINDGHEVMTIHIAKSFLPTAVMEWRKKKLLLELLL